MKLFKALTLVALTGFASLPTHAALQVTFLGGSTQLNGATFYQRVTNVTNTGLTPGLSVLSAFGKISNNNNTYVCSTGPCELTYVLSNLTYQTLSAGSPSMPQSLLFSGGTLSLFIDTSPDAVAINNPSFLSNSGATTFASAMGSYADGQNLLNLTGHQADAIPVANGFPSNSTTTTTSTSPVSFFGMNYCPNPANPTNPQSFTLTTSATCPAYSITANAYTGATFSLLVGPTSLVGSALFDKQSGPAFNNFVNSIVGPLPSLTLGALSTVGSVTDKANSCSIVGTDQFCIGSLSASANINPPSVSLISEPASLALMGLSLGGLGWAARRRKTVALS